LFFPLENGRGWEEKRRREMGGEGRGMDDTSTFSSPRAVYPSDTSHPAFS
jgi:hypothetical protein